MLRQIKRLFAINWYRTLQLNFKLLPWAQACHCPVVVYGPLLVESLSGRLELPADAGFGTLQIGSRHESYKGEAGKAQLTLRGVWKVGHNVKVGIDCCVYVAPNAELQMGDNCAFARDSQFQCFGRMSFGNHVWSGELYATDNASHYIFRKGEQQPMIGEIVVEDNVYMSSKVILLKGTVIPEGSVVGAGAVCTHDFFAIEKNPEARNLFIVGCPAYVKDHDVHAV